jgi:hypothetical protein
MKLLAALGRRGDVEVYMITPANRNAGSKPTQS